MNIKNLNKVLILSSALVLPAMAAELDPAAGAGTVRAAAPADYVMGDAERAALSRFQERSKILSQSVIDTAFKDAVEARYRVMVSYMLGLATHELVMERIRISDIIGALDSVLATGDAEWSEWFLNVAPKVFTESQIVSARARAARAASGGGGGGGGSSAEDPVDAG